MDRTKIKHEDKRTSVSGAGFTFVTYEKKYPRNHSMKLNVHRVSKEDYDDLPYPEKGDGDTKWKTLELSDGREITFFKP